MKCTSPLYVLDRDKLPLDKVRTFDRFFDSQSHVFVNSSDLRDKYSFFLLNSSRSELANSAWPAV